MDISTDRDVAWLD